eukprot:15865580-Heterocapsa_arctica.AAC.1
MGAANPPSCRVSLTGLCVGSIPLGKALYAVTELRRQWLTRNKYSSLGSPSSGKHVNCLSIPPGRNPDERDARAWIHS